MIPKCEIEKVVRDPLPTLELPRRDEIPEESWGGFRDTWYLGQISLGEAREVLNREREALEALDHAAGDQEEFESLARALEWGETDGLNSELLQSFNGGRLRQLMRDPEDFSPWGGLEIGVSGLVHALSAVGCLTAASCRWHGGDKSWSECPVVFFAALPPGVEAVADLVRKRNCGLRAARSFLVIEGESVVELNSLAASVIEQRTGG